MSDLAERLSKLSPDKRNLLLQKIRQTKPEADQKPPARPGEKRPFVPEDGNFILRVGRIGDVNSLKFDICPRRAPRPREVEVQICAASLNFRDVMIAVGLYPTPPGKVAALGGDCAGRVVSVGEGVNEFQAGDEVIVSTGDTFSAFTTAAVSDVLPKPAAMSFVEAATIPTVFLTAYYSLHYLARLAKGERVLIHSAAGGVGLAAVQVAQWLGADIIATVGNAEKRAYLQSLGVEKIANSRSPDFDLEVKELTGGEGLDVVLNSLAGEAIPKGLKLLRALGRFIELGKRDLYSDGHLDFRLFRKFVAFFAVDIGPVSSRRQALFHSMFIEIMELFAAGTFKVLPIREFAIGEIAEAFAYMSKSEHIGKIAIRLDGEEVLVMPQ
jgi:NADPH:quinone reductase-like Zn-dependent oxidoreductase